MANSVKENLFIELEKRLMMIQSSSGYENDVKKVYTEVTMPGQLQEFPCIVIDQGPEKQVATPSKGLIEKVLIVYLDCYIHDANNLAGAIRKIEKDIELLFYRDVYTTSKGYSINNTVFEAMIVGSEPFGTITEAPNGGVTIELSIRYHQNIVNPTQKS